MKENSVKNKAKVVVVLGPESTGKSMLCELLAKQFSTGWCREYAREYLIKYGKDYDFETLLKISKGQLSAEESCREQFAKHSVMFFDTNMYVMQVWCEYVFVNCHYWILDKISELQFDMYLLCKPDLPWVEDALREYPDEKNRWELYHMYKTILMNQGVAWHEVSGNYAQRAETAIQYVEELLGRS